MRKIFDVVYVKLVERQIKAENFVVVIENEAYFSPLNDAPRRVR